MIDIPNTAAFELALALPLDPALKDLLRWRRDQLLTDTGGEYELGELVRFVVAEPNDGIAEIEAAAGYPLITDGAFEWVQQHGHVFEAATILSDDGFGIVLLVPDVEGVDATLLQALRSHLNTDLPISHGANGQVGTEQP